MVAASSCPRIQLFADCCFPSILLPDSPFFATASLLFPLFFYFFYFFASLPPPSRYSVYNGQELSRVDSAIQLIVAFLSVIIGMMTFAGSLVAVMKLMPWESKFHIDAKPKTFTGACVVFFLVYPALGCHTVPEHASSASMPCTNDCMCPRARVLTRPSPLFLLAAAHCTSAQKPETRS